MSDALNGAAMLVTGADGFIGSHLVELLVARGARVKAFVYYNSWNSVGWLADIPQAVRDKLEIISGDIRDTERVREAVRGCSHVFHLASLIAIPYSYYAARSYVETNIFGTLNVLQACRENDKLARLVHISTSETYGTAQRVPIDEDHPLVGQSPYSASKIGADKMAESFYLSFGLPVVTARPFNTFGPRQTARAVIPTIASQLLAGVNELKLGALTPTRDFNYATDTAEGMIALALADNVVGLTINIGTGEEWSIENTANMLMEITGCKVPIHTEEDRMRPAGSEVNRLLADNRRILELTDWSPKVSFEQGLVNTVEWIRANPQFFTATRYNI
jgi:NAD dependent epimerase/dehydratase